MLNKIFNHAVLKNLDHLIPLFSKRPVHTYHHQIDYAVSCNNLKTLQFLMMKIEHLPSKSYLREKIIQSKNVPMAVYLLSFLPKPPDEHIKRHIIGKMYNANDIESLRHWAYPPDLHTSMYFVDRIGFEWHQSFIFAFIETFGDHFLTKSHIESLFVRLCASSDRSLNQKTITVAMTFLINRFSFEITQHHMMACFETFFFQRYLRSTEIHVEFLLNHGAQIEWIPDSNIQMKIIKLRTERQTAIAKTLANIIDACALKCVITCYVDYVFG